MGSRANVSSGEVVSELTGMKSESVLVGSGRGLCGAQSSVGIGAVA